MEPEDVLVELQNEAPPTEIVHDERGGGQKEKCSSSRSIVCLRCEISKEGGKSRYILSFSSAKEMLEWETLQEQLTKQADQFGFHITPMARDENHDEFDSDKNKFSGAYNMHDSNDTDTIMIEVTSEQRVRAIQAQLGAFDRQRMSLTNVPLAEQKRFRGMIMKIALDMIDLNEFWPLAYFIYDKINQRIVLPRILCETISSTNGRADTTITKIAAPNELFNTIEPIQQLAMFVQAHDSEFDILTAIHAKPQEFIYSYLKHITYYPKLLLLVWIIFTLILIICFITTKRCIVS